MKYEGFKLNEETIDKFFPKDDIDIMGYKSPITLFQERMAFNIAEAIDVATVEAVARIGVDVDKDELIKALEYDRDQYNEGYRNGYCRGRQFDGWISVSDSFPEEDERVLVWLRENDSYTRIDTDRMLGGKWVRWNSFVTHWMPLPEAPKERYWE